MSGELGLASGEYEDDVASNSSWGTDNWDGDADVTTSDLVLGLADGGYEQGPRQAVAVPEPAGALLLSLGVLSLCCKKMTVASRDRGV